MGGSAGGRAAGGHTAGAAAGCPTAGGLTADWAAARLAAAGSTALVLALREAAACGVVADSVAVHRCTAYRLAARLAVVQLLDPQQVD